ncbi:MAG: hypothetical protein H6619_03195 [Deltaproteobacteria bacterium]|nr:hypothetical protein [Deltaproteobacteria bacterium]
MVFLDDGNGETLGPESEGGLTPEEPLGNDPDLFGRNLTITFRGNRAYSAIVPLVVRDLQALGCRVDVLEIPAGTQDSDVKTTIEKRRHEFADRIVLADNTVTRQLNGDPVERFPLSLDLVVEDELRRFLLENTNLQQRRVDILSIPDDLQDSRRILGLQHEMFATLMADAIQQTPPDHVCILPHFMCHHEPFFQNLFFLLDTTLATDLMDAERESIQGYRQRLEDSIVDATQETKLPEDVLEIMERKLGFNVKQPHDLIAKSLVLMGVDPDKITIIHKSRGDLTDSDFAHDGNVWVFANRHALRYGDKTHVANVNEVIGRNAQATLLRLPLETLLMDLTANGMIQFEDRSPIDEISSRCASSIAARLAA